MHDAVIARRTTIAAGVGLLGMTLLALFADRIATPWARPLAVLGVVATSVGAAYAVGLWVSPAPRALLLRHLAAGSSAAWLARELAATADRLGIESTAFRVLWAPVSEEACKALFLAAVWSLGDDRRDRRDLVTAAVGVGVGFAIRENFVYFASALGQPGVVVEWIALRAVPPVLAHAAFAMILGGTIAHGAIHARVCGETVKRVSIVGASVAIVAHLTYNGVALLLTRGAETYAVELAGAWSICAALVAFWLRRRTIAAAAEDQPVVTTIVPSPDQTGVQVAGLIAAVAALVAIPYAPLRMLGVVCAPLAVGTAIAYGVSRLARSVRVLTPVLLGIAARPLVRAAELILGAFGPGSTLATRTLLQLLAHACWLALVAHAARVWASSRGRMASIAFATALAAGLAGADLGATLTTVPPEHALRALAMSLPRALPTTLALGAFLGGWGSGSRSRAWMATGVAAMLATALDALSRVLHGAASSLVAAALGLGGLAWVLFHGRRAGSDNENARVAAARI